MIFDLPPIALPGDMTIGQATAAARLRDALDTLTSGRTDVARREIESLLKDLEEKKQW